MKGKPEVSNYKDFYLNELDLNLLHLPAVFLWIFYYLHTAINVKHVVIYDGKTYADFD